VAAAAVEKTAAMAAVKPSADVNSDGEIGDKGGFCQNCQIISNPVSSFFG
jgi:hypothetical protein